MASSYSLDFREKVISHVQAGNSYNSTAIKFDIAANTVSNWYRRYKSEGSYKARKVGGKKGRVTSEEIVSYVNAHPNFILAEMGEYFNMSAAGAHYWLKKMGYSYKKKPLPMWKRAKRGVKNTKKR